MFGPTEENWVNFYWILFPKGLVKNLQAKMTLTATFWTISNHHILERQLRKNESEFLQLRKNISAFSQLCKNASSFWHLHFWLMRGLGTDHVTLCCKWEALKKNCIARGQTHIGTLQLIELIQEKNLGQRPSDSAGPPSPCEHSIVIKCHHALYYIEPCWCTSPPCTAILLHPSTQSPFRHCHTPAQIPAHLSYFSPPPSLHPRTEAGLYISEASIGHRYWKIRVKMQYTAVRNIGSSKTHY